MKKDYYTPEMEEFHSGFEFEYLYGSEWHKHNLDGSPIIHHELDEFKDDLMKLAHAIVRVKHLDKEDIEECGWDFYQEMEKTYLDEPCLMFHNDELNLMLGFYYHSNRISLATKDPSKSEIFLKTNQDPNRISLLKVKNKAEFQKIIKMLDA